MNKLIIFIMLITAADLYAADLDRGAVPFKAEGTIITISPIRDAPPHGVFNLLLGQGIESTVKNSKVKIIGKKSYGGFSGVNIWYQVESVNDLITSEEQPLWIYGGVEGQKQQVQINQIIE